MRSTTRYDNAVAESFHALFKTELVRGLGPWRGLDDLELATLEWIDWCNHPTAASVVLVPLGDVRLPRGRSSRKAC